MSRVTIDYSPGGTTDKQLTQEVEPDQLAAAIRRIQKQFQKGLDHPLGVHVVNAKGDHMTVVFDDREGFLMYMPNNDVEWTRYSQGDLRRKDFRVFYLPESTELSGKYMVPTGKVLEALKKWAESGEFSPTIDWTTEILH